MKYFLILPLFFSLFALPAYAQDDTQSEIVGNIDVGNTKRDGQKTRREQIIHDLMQVPDGTIIDIKGTEDTVLKNEERDDTVLEPRGSSSEKTMLDTLLDVITSEIFKPKEQTKQKKTVSKKARPIAPFYFSAEDYLKARGEVSSQQLVMHYEVSSGAASGEGLATVKDVILTIGENFAAMRVDKNLTIYDFKLDRILSLKPEYNMSGKTTGKVLFENTSLYSKVYRDITAVRRATNNGRLTKLDMGQGTILDAYWVESAMSWAGGHLKTDIEIKKTEKVLNIKHENDVVFSAKFMDEAYENSGTKNSLFAFAHHEWPLHPSVLRELYAYGAPPKWFEMLSYGPTAPKGQKQVWTLVDREDIDAEFPLPVSATGTAQAKNVSPLVFLINEAVHNRALGGIKSVAELKVEFDENFERNEVGDIAQAWFIGQRYLAYTGIDCEDDNSNSVCVGIKAYENAKIGHRSHLMLRYIMANHLAGKGTVESRLDLLKTVKKDLEEKIAPAFIYRLAGMARAKLTKQQAKDGSVYSMSAEHLLQTALAKDPYDPNTYVGLAQVLAAKGALEQSWDVYDALRVDIPTASSLDLKINRLEQKLRKSAPGYFLE